VHTLSEYLEHFNGRPATYIGEIPSGIQGPPTSATPGFGRLQQALGLGARVSEGDAVRLTPHGLEPIDYLRPNRVAALGSMA
jgi:hypothetical protein